MLSLIDSACFTGSDFEGGEQALFHILRKIVLRRLKYTRYEKPAKTHS